VFDFLSHHAMMMLAWADRADEAIARWRTVGHADREAAAIRAIEMTLAEYPAPSDP
jgi:hypothetical protein